MNLKINTLKIQNFMGISDITLHISGGDMNISGANGTGKTTVKSAFSWLLFGKNTYGKTDFEIKPLDSEGNEIHYLETSVEAEFDVDGDPLKLKRVFQEKWTRRQGSANKEFKGHETTFFVNDIPKKKTEFNDTVTSLISEEVFKTITDPLYFNEQIKWDKRREMLMDICGDISNEDVISSNPELFPLLNMLKNRTVDELKQVVATQMKNINNELDLIPAKINEAELAKPSIEHIHDNEEERSALVEKIEDLRVKRSNIVNGAELVRLRAEKMRLENERDAIKTQFLIDSATHQELRSKTDQLESLRDSLKGLNRQKDELNTNLAKHEAEKERLSARWDETQALRFTGENCPVCGRPLDEDTVNSKKKRFNIKRVEALDEIEAELMKIKEEESNTKASLADIEGAIEVVVGNIDQFKLQIIDLENRVAHEKEAYELRAEEKRLAYNETIADLVLKISEYETNAKEDVSEIGAEIISLERELGEKNKAIAQIETHKRQEARIQELMGQQVKLSAEYTKLERDMYLIEQFTKAKVKMLDEKISEHFELAQFKMFEEQINGGIKETCETTFQGVPYSDLNSAARVNVGLDIINTICEKGNVFAPIFIDNAESVNTLLDTESQQIRLYVSDDESLLV